MDCLDSDLKMCACEHATDRWDHSADIYVGI